jgi:hypothetical protein
MAPEPLATLAKPSLDDGFSSDIKQSPKLFLVDVFSFA